MSSTDVNAQLIINEMPKTKYKSLLSSNEINENELYLVKEDNIDAYDKNVNVADPVSAKMRLINNILIILLEIYQVY